MIQFNPLMPACPVRGMTKVVTCHRTTLYVHKEKCTSIESQDEDDDVEDMVFSWWPDYITTVHESTSDWG